MLFNTPLPAGHTALPCTTMLLLLQLCHSLMMLLLLLLLLLLCTWLNASSRKPMFMPSTMGRRPVMAAPMPMPMKPFSAAQTIRSV
jgi:hypothetical protein